jgi:hypothetical protein
MKFAILETSATGKAIARESVIHRYDFAAAMASQSSIYCRNELNTKMSYVGDSFT